MANRILARLNIAGSKVVEIIREQSNLADEWHADFIKKCIDVTNVSPQPTVGWTYADGKFGAPAPYQPSPARQMIVALAEGAVVTFAGAPALDATYYVAGPRWQQMRDEALYITMFGAFSGGVAALPWQTKTGEVTFTTTAQLLAVVRALVDRVSAWQAFVDGRSSAPTGPVIVA